MGEHRGGNRGGFIMVTSIDHRQECMVFIRIAKDCDDTLVLEKLRPHRIKLRFIGYFPPVRRRLWNLNRTHWRLRRKRCLPGEVEWFLKYTN